MKKPEKIIAALLATVLGVLLILLKAKVISIALTVAGVCLLAFGILSLVEHAVPLAIIRLAVGVLLIICAWSVVRAVLYILAAILLVAGLLILYYKVKKGVICDGWLKLINEYATPAFLLLVGVLLLFNQNNTVDWVFIISGVLTVAEGGLLFANALISD